MNDRVVNCYRFFPQDISDGASERDSIQRNEPETGLEKADQVCCFGLTFCKLYFCFEGTCIKCLNR